MAQTTRSMMAVLKEAWLDQSLTAKGMYAQVPIYAKRRDPVADILQSAADTNAASPEVTALESSLFGKQNS